MRDVADRPLPADPDIDLRQAAQRAELRRAPWRVLLAIAAGGAVGSLARYGVALARPAAPDGFPWATLLVNVVGCLLIGVLTVLLVDVWAGRWLLRPFLGVGVLGGFTTFSTYAVDIERLARSGAGAAALAYLAGTVLAALAAAYLGMVGTRALVTKAGSRRRAASRTGSGERRTP